MDFHHHHHHGGSPSSTTTTTTTSSSLIPTNSQNGQHSDPMHSWWESISKARSRIQLLSSILPPQSQQSEDEEEESLSLSLSLSSLADTDRPARSLLLSSAAYSALSLAVHSPSSGSGHDPICQWLYDTYLSSDPDLRLVVLSYIPLIAAVYLRRIHHPQNPNPTSLSGFEAVFLALYSAETKARNGKPLTISIPDLSQPSLYHSPRNPPANTTKSSPNSTKAVTVGVLSPPLEPQIAVKSTKRACIVGVALDCYYKQISQMPSWSKLDFCKFAAVWAGQNCPCTSEFDQGFLENGDGFGNDSSIVVVDQESGEIENVVERVKDLDIEDEDERIPLPWELLQPVLRILAHCLLGPLNVDEVKNAASVAVRRLCARASHDLAPQAILATRSLIQLDKRASEAARAAAMAAANGSGSSVNTPSKAKKPEVLLVSK